MNSKTPTVDRRTRALFRKLDRITRQIESKPAPEPVHQLRTTVRRIETLIAAHGLGEELSKVARQLARLRRRAGKVRDIDVQITALRSIRTDTGAHDKAVLARHLAKVRGKRADKLRAALEDELSGGLRKRLEHAAEPLVQQGDSAPQQDFTAEALRKFRTLVQAYPLFTEENLHQFRMDCKRIRYLAEMNETTEAQKLVAAFKRVQDAIGEWHDWFTLVEVAEEIVENRTAPLVAMLRARRQSKLHEALRVVEETKRRLLEHPTASGHPPRKGAARVSASGTRKANAATG